MTDGTDEPISNALRWAADLLTGSLATTACILAVAALGGLMLMGHVSIERAGRVIVGCFILLSAGSVVGAVVGTDRSAPVTLARQDPLPPPTSATPPDDPYAFASLIR